MASFFKMMDDFTIFFLCTTEEKAQTFADAIPCTCTILLWKKRAVKKKEDVTNKDCIRVHARQ
jgi:hypothetical protein